MSSATNVTITSVGDTNNIHSVSTNATNFVTNLSLVPSGGASANPASCPNVTTSCSYKQFWIVFWIQETGAVQSDTGTWYATIEFKDSAGKGITSTIAG